MLREQQSIDLTPLVFIAIVLLGLYFAVQNIPEAQIGTHAIERHGADAQAAIDHWRAGCETEVYRNLYDNRIMRIVRGPATYCIIQTIGGLPVTAYRASESWCTNKVAEGGWELITIEPVCE